MKTVEAIERGDALKESIHQTKKREEDSKSLRLPLHIRCSERHKKTSAKTKKHGKKTKQNFVAEIEKQQP